MMKRIGVVSVYAIAMGYVEAAVVVYIRQMIFGNTVQVFPMKYLQPSFAFLEIGREAMTILMLLAVGYLAGKSRFQKWMYFVFAFAIWDLGYYIFLRIATGWPTSLLDFDVLFLIPVVWIGPVISPVLISLLLAVTSFVLIRLGGREDHIRVGKLNFWLFTVGCAIVFYSFTGEIFNMLIVLGPKGLQNDIPGSYNWVAFVIGYIIMCMSAVKTIINCYHNSRSRNEGSGKKVML